MITFEMTGFVELSTKGRNIRYKEDFVNYVKQFGWVHTKLTKNTTYLLYSKTNTSKYNTAKRYGVKTITYNEALNMIERNAIWEEL